MNAEFGVEPDESSAIQYILVLPVVDGQCVELLSYSDAAYSVIGGSAQITDALGKKLAGQIHLGMKLTGIKESHAKFRLAFANQPAIDADIMIVTIPFSVLDGIVLDVKLPPLLRRFINEAKLGSNEKVIGSFFRRFWRQVCGFSDSAWGNFGFCVVWDVTQRQSSRPDGALNFFLGGNQARQLANTPNVSLLGKQLVSRLNRFISGASAAGTGRFIHTGWTKSPLTTGGYASYKPGQLTRFMHLFWFESKMPGERQQVHVGNLIFAGEHLSDVFYGFMNGGAQTGRLAANLVLEIIAKTALAPQ